jgi:hypothetical protein
VGVGEFCGGEVLRGNGCRFWKTQIERGELADRGPVKRCFFAIRRQSGLEVCERCAVCDVNLLRQPGHV